LVAARLDNARLKLSIMSSYVPRGSSGEDRQAAKYGSLDIIYRGMVEAGSRGYSGGFAAPSSAASSPNFDR
jgi:hypothetical protein